MSREIYNTVLRKLAVEVPLFAEIILNKALAKVGTTPDEATPFQLKTAIEQYIEPSLKDKLHLRKGLHELGMGTILLDKNGNVKEATPSAYKLIPDLGKRKYLLGEDITSETIKIKGTSVHIVRIPSTTKAVDSGDSVCIVSDITLDKEIDKEMEEKYQELLDKNKELIKLHFITKSSETELAESEARYKIIAQETGQLIYDYDLVSGQILWDGAIEKVTGYKPDKFKLNIDEWGKRIHPDDRKESFKLLDDARKKGKKYRCEYRFKIKDGSYRYMTDSGVFLKDKKGKEYRMIGVMNDVTTVHEANIKIKETAERLNHFLENIDDLVQSVDVKGNFIYVNKKWKQVMGYTDKEAMKMNILDIISKEHKSMCKQLFKQASKGKVLNDIETVFLTKNRKKVNVKGNTQPFIKDGKLISTISIFRDITETIKAQNIIKISELTYRTIFNASTDAIFMHDAKTGKILDVNSTVFDIYGYTIDEALKLDIGTISAGFGEYTQEEAVKRVQKASQGEDQKFEWQCKRKDGKTFWAEVSLKKANISGNQVILAVVRDITDTKTYFADLQKKNMELERFNKLAVGRELRMIELKKKLNDLEGRK